MSSFIDMTGRRFARLRVVGVSARSNENKSVYWTCECECGTVKDIDGRSLRQGKTVSCGCLKDEKTSGRFRKHGMADTKIYGVWKSMKARCYRTSCRDYPDYGGRGISVCAEWRSNFQNFYDWALSAGYREGLSIDRVDVNGHYNPGNCQWADDFTQANNRTNNRAIAYQGKTYSLSELSRAFEINYSSLRMRINLGWDIERAITEPFVCGKNQYSMAVRP